MMMNARAQRLIEDARQKGARPLLHISSPSARPRSDHVSQALHSQTGSMLLESFIAILIFSMGILAIVGMQASAIKNSGDAKYRSEASLLANELLGRMWVSDRTGTDPLQPALTLQTNFQGGGGADGLAYTAWFAQVQATLPGSSTDAPTVTVDPASGRVSVTVRWKAPNEPASAAAHSYAVAAQIR
jgi:type IV pilus assembly protein PilV